MGQMTEMSKGAYDALVAERESVAALVEAARERVEHAQNGGGDSEGLEGVEAIFEAESISGRLHQIDQLLRTAVVVSGGGDVVGIGSQIVLDFGDGPEEYTMDNVARSGCIGTESPIGAAVTGKRAGDVVEVQAPGGTYLVSILRVS